MDKKYNNKVLKKVVSKTKQKKKKKKSGFTLIELLAVIVILGLLMAIAIPSITKYVNQSKRKTTVSSIEGYISSVLNDVNDQSYRFSTPNTIYAIPIDCVSLEKGGKNSFGDWGPVSEVYWAYVLVQYNSKDFSYTYGFTFKDSEGYGMYPTSQDSIDIKSSSQIKTNLKLTKPESGLAVNIIDKDNWLGFDVDGNTKLIVLEGNSSLECSNHKQVKVTSGTGNDRGDIIKIGVEKFYVIGSTDTTVTLLTEKPINPDVNNPVQNESAATSKFASSNYWATQTGSNSYILKSKYENGNPPYVYDSNSYVYQYVEAYESYLKGLGVLSADASLINYDQLIALDCNDKVSTFTCKNSKFKDWVVPGYYWGSGSVSNVGNGLIWGVYPNGNLSNIYYPQPVNVRPIVTILKSEIKSN